MVIIMEKEDSYYIEKIKVVSNLFDYNDDELKLLLKELRDKNFLCLLDDYFFELIAYYDDLNAVDIIETILLPEKIHERDISMFYHINEVFLATYQIDYLDNHKYNNITELLRKVSYHTHTIFDIIDCFESNYVINEKKAKYGLVIEDLIRTFTIYYVFFAFTNSYNSCELFNLFLKYLDDYISFYDYLHMNGVTAIYRGGLENKTRYYKVVENLFKKSLNYKENRIK